MAAAPQLGGAASDVRERKGQRREVEGREKAAENAEMKNGGPTYIIYLKRLYVSEV